LQAPDDRQIVFVPCAFSRLDDTFGNIGDGKKEAKKITTF